MSPTHKRKQNGKQERAVGDGKVAKVAAATEVQGVYTAQMPASPGGLVGLEGLCCQL